MSVLSVESVAKNFAGVRALSDVSLAVERGEIVSVIGPNGAGKTTLLNMIHGFTEPSAGVIRFGEDDPIDLARLTVEDRSRRGIGRTFQTVQLFASLTVEENLLVAAQRGRLAGSARELTRAAATFCGIEGLLQRRAGDLPLGEGRKVELARALCLRPTLLLLDEPVSGMSDAATEDVAELLDRCREVLDVSILLIDHDMRFVMDVSDYIYVLDFGEVVAEGTPDEVAADEAVMAAYVGSIA
jgi:branched-chain amino acid transport system ATP-binding protein